MPRRQHGQAVVEKKAEKLTELSITYLETESLIPNDYNPNRQNEHEFHLLCKSIEEDGFTQPIIVGKDDRIVDGEHRWRAARELGIERVPVVRVPMEAAQAKIATLRHNRARGSEDVELSVAVLRDLEALGALDWAADSLDLDDTELQRLLDDIPAPEALASEEFTESWVPGGIGSDTQSSTADGQIGSTAAAADMVRARELALRSAKTEEERQSIRRDRSVYRLSLTFTNEEATVVKTVLGTAQPAVQLIALCQAAYDQLPPEQKEPVAEEEAAA